MITLKKIFRALKKINKWAAPTTDRIYEIWTERRNGGAKDWRETALAEILYEVVEDPTKEQFNTAQYCCETAKKTFTDDFFKDALEEVANLWKEWQEWQEWQEWDELTVIEID